MRSGARLGYNSEVLEPSLVVVIPTFAPGASILPTLTSLEASVGAWFNQTFTLVLSDSSPVDDITNEARSWAETANCVLVVDHSYSRRYVQEALNVAFSKKEVSGADLVLVTNDDVVFDVSCVSILMRTLCEEVSATMVVGCALPDPRYLSGGRRAGAWQMKAAERIIRRWPATTARAEGSIWATRGTFAGSYRYPLGSGSISDDIELQNHVLRNGLICLSVAQAVVYKIPPRGFAEFSIQSRRNFASSIAGEMVLPSKWVKLKVGFICMLGDPLGAIHYLSYRTFMLLGAGKGSAPSGERWERASSTWR